MQLIYYQRTHSNGATVPNFGDQLNSWMWEEALSGVWQPDDGICFLGIGTILDRTIIGNSLLSSGRKFVVFSSGVGYGLVPKQFGSSDWRTISVRGPLSARALGLDPKYSITDGAALLPTLSRYRDDPKDRRDIVFMPHHDSEVVGHWEEVCTAAGFRYLSPTAGSQELVDHIRSAKLVLADAMHAAIVADAFRVPWIPLTTSCYINTFKWIDWTLSLNLPYEPIALPPSSSLEVLRALTLPLSLKKFRVVPPTPAATIAHFVSKQGRKLSGLLEIYGEFAGRALCGLPGRIYNSHRLAPLRLKDKSLYVESAAAALYEASRGVKYLSSDRTHEQKINQMTEKLHSVPEIVRSLAC